MGFSINKTSSLDENDNSPNFEKPFYSFNVNEETEAIFYVKAVDMDEGPNGEITYKIVNGTVEGISINETDGRIFVKKFDAENADWLSKNLTVQAMDNGTPSKSNTTIVQIVIKVAFDFLYPHLLECKR